MPQLDQVTFLSQFFWLCVFFFGFYFLISKDFLPKMGRILKLRKRKMGVSIEGGTSVQQENEKVRESGRTLVENGLNASSHLLVSNLQRIETWLTQTIVETNKNSLEKTNKLYIQWVGDNSIRQQLALQAAAPVSNGASPRVFLSILVEKCRKKRPSVKQSTPVWQFRSDSLDQSFSEKVVPSTLLPEATQTRKSKNPKK